MRFRLLFIFSFLICGFANAQHRGDSVDCSNRIDYSWVKAFGNADNDVVSDVAVDNLGNIYITGTFSSSLDIYGNSISSLGETDFYVAKFLPEGSLVWLKSCGSAGEEQANAIAVDGNGNVYVAGLSSDNTSFGENAFPSRGGLDGFLLKLDTDGNFIYARTFGSYLTDNAFDVAVASDNSVYVTGYFNYALQIGGTSHFQMAVGAEDAFLVHLDASGNVLWSMSHSSPSYDCGMKVVCEGTNVILASVFSGNVFFGATQLSSPNTNSVYVAKMNSAGNVQWAKKLGDAANTDYEVSALGVKPNGEVFVAYNAEDDNSIIARYSSAGVWQESLDFSGYSNIIVQVSDILS
ncbi:MAG: SBBP repeat-containing protein, partial [Bacteroidales bacterium]|nr:SBBP repeat-containing protein [Bacteroidales bacterium]